MEGTSSQKTVIEGPERSLQTYRERSQNGDRWLRSMKPIGRGGSQKWQPRVQSRNNQSEEGAKNSK